MRTRASKAQQKATAFLQNSIAENESPRSIAALARDAGVSYVTMWKAVQALKETGAISGKYRIAKSSAEDDAIEVTRKTLPENRRALFAEQCTRDLLNGSIVRGNQLWSAKELSARYGTSPQTIARILHNLHAQGLVVPSGRGWARFGPVERKPMSIALVAFMTLQHGTALTWLEHNLLRSCELACVRAGVGLEVAALRRYDDPGVGLRSGSIDALPGGDQFAGYIYMVEEADLHEAIIRRLISFGKPVAIMDASLPRHMTLGPSRARRFRLVPQAQAAIDMAAFVLAKGHRHIAYISPFHADNWSQVRHDTIRRIVERNGGTVTPFTAPYSINVHFSTQGYVHAKGDEIVKAISRWEDTIPPAFVPDVEVVKDQIARTMLFSGEIRSELIPLMDAAASDKRITAWIMANDRTGRMALAYCQSKGIEVPGKLGIVAFDDEPESCEWRLTSYNYNTEALAAAMVHYILHPTAGHWRSGSRPTAIRGFVVERESG